MNTLIASERIALGVQAQREFPRIASGPRTCILYVPFHSFYFILFGVLAVRQPANLYYVHTRKSETGRRKWKCGCCTCRSQTQDRGIDRRRRLAASWIFSPPTLLLPPRSVLLHCLDPPHPNCQPDTTHHCVRVRPFKHTDTPLFF
jgi:hypothetical protein